MFGLLKKLASVSGGDAVVADAVAEGRRLCALEGSLEAVSSVVRARDSAPHGKKAWDQIAPALESRPGLEVVAVATADDPPVDLPPADIAMVFGGDGAILRQRMTPARLGVSALQHVIGAGEEDEADLEFGISTQPLDALQQGFRAEAPGAAVDGNRHGPLEPVGRGQKSQRQVVDRLVAQILQRPQSRAVAGSGEAGDEDEGQA